MQIAIMQPTYLPWLGYLELMISSDAFVYFDDVQFVKKSWQQRNRIKSPSGELVLTVPVCKKGAQFQNINEARLDNTKMWRKKHLSSIEANYTKSTFFDRYIEEIRSIYSKEYEYLLDLNLKILDFLRRGYGITTPVTLSSSLELGDGANRNEYAVNICKAMNAEVLYDAAGAAPILYSEYFKHHGVQLIFQRYTPVAYNQLHPPFIPYLSALDVLLNEGDNAKSILLSGVG